ncbi:DUF1499 domain-containing protein [Roseobacter sinensis]|uniref:DUF1499 domain-containing protein n=1 Tax=Roseobacter sinensis TaxID=2931391 RepID=A0ABT3BEE5_9RHOB|nr:DUF1499 domain-containing protein [Roseobacter sp. WL0113]MCV3271917.1 DUF1499 domain-containing protein [Roseobacter sp. WL0113]
MVLWGLIGAIVAAMAYVRLAPIDPERWHLPVEMAEDADLAGGAVRVIPAEEGTLQAVDELMRGLPRTRVLAGSVDAGHVTYVTRSAVFGFPDMTTVELRGNDIRMFGRLRFGASDLGVNRKRLEGVIAALE